MYVAHLFMCDMYVCMGVHMCVHSTHRLACLCLCDMCTCIHGNKHMCMCVCVPLCGGKKFVQRACSSSRFKPRGLVRSPGSQVWCQVAEGRQARSGRGFLGAAAVSCPCNCYVAVHREWRWVRSRKGEGLLSRRKELQSVVGAAAGWTAHRHKQLG